MSIFSRKIAMVVAAVVMGSFVCLPSASASASHVATVAESSNAVVQSVQSTQPAVTLTKTNGKYYVNNHEITLEFNYDSEFYDRTAWYKSHFNIRSTPTTSITFAEIGDFDTNWGYSMTKDHVLGVRVNNLDGYVYRSCGGAYKDKPDYYSVLETTMMVDPDTGRVFDFLEGNYFYKHGYMNYHFINKQPVTCEGC